MSRRVQNRYLSCAAAFAAIISASTVHAQPATRWTATSSTSIFVTGDITLDGNTLIFGNGKKLALTPIGLRQGRWTPVSHTPGMLYKLSPPSDPVLLAGTTLCGAPVTYIVLSRRSAQSLSMTVFYGPKQPRGFGEDSCAVYFYER